MRQAPKLYTIKTITEYYTINNDLFAAATSCRCRADDCLPFLFLGKLMWVDLDRFFVAELMMCLKLAMYFVVDFYFVSIVFCIIVCCII